MNPGVIFLKIHSMNATFGKLQAETLELKDGLNIIQAPNESGKSTWCAFLSSMLYGMNSRERDRIGYIADKNRYAPWSGASMCGRIDCTVGTDELTLMRITQRPNAPLADFRAVYTGTRDQVPGLTGQNCGEQLLGVSREIFERSSFIRQAGLPIRQDPELERRIASLITSGEEDTSYTEAAAALKKQLNRRRHNKTGQIPALEAEWQERLNQLADLEVVEQQLCTAKTDAAALAEQVSALEAELDRCIRWEARNQQQALADAQQAAEETEQRAAALRQQLDLSRLPENSDIGRLRGAIVNLQTARRSVEKARDVRDEAMKAVLRAEPPVNESPFAGQTAESAAREAQKEPPRRSPAAVILLVLGLAGLVGVLLAHYSMNVLPENWFPLLSGACGGVMAVGLVQFFSYSRKAKDFKALLLRRFGTDDPAAIAQLAQDYADRLSQLEAAQEDMKAKSVAADSLYASLSSNEQAILLEIRRFAPQAFDLSAADSLLRSCAVHRKELQEAETAAREARMLLELLRQQPAAADRLPVPTTAPAHSRKEVEAALEEARARLETARSASDRLTGQLHAAGDPDALRADADRLEAQISTLEAEFAAITLAMEALDNANTSLQNRFSPALGRKTAEIFRELTGGRYQNVVLDRALQLSAEPAGDPISRDIQLLSAGASDQLYLAARLAICELVLPQDKSVPLILDDALTNFDDQRCEAALRWLKKEAAHRQILLFTCHHRESDFFVGDAEVSIQRLTNPC